MASRQRAFSDDPPQHGIVDEEIVSGAGEGDEIMEEVEEQEDGYSAYISNSPFVYIHRLLLLLIHNKIILTNCMLSISFIYANFNINMDQLVLFFTWP